MDEQSSKHKSVLDTCIYALAFVGLVSMLGAAVWGIVRVSESAPVAFSNLTAAVAGVTSQFFPAGERPGAIVFTMPSTNATSGSPYTFSWSGGAGNAYTFTYTCADNFSFDIPGRTDAAKITCGESFAFTNTTDSITLIPRLNDNLEAQEVAATVSDGTAKGTVSVVVTAANSDSTDAVGTADTAATRATPLVPRTETEIIGDGAAFAIDPDGKPDLFGYVLALGYIDDDTDQFVATSTVGRYDTAAVRFEVRNIGSQSSGEWNFEAKLPTSPSHTYEPRTPQQSLNPGDRIEFTLSFDRIRRSNTGTVVIEIDPDNELDEFTRTNNQIEAVFTVEN